MRGHFEEYLYDDSGTLVETVDMVPGGNVLNVPAMQWHSLRSLESGTVHLVGTNRDLIVSEVSPLLDDAVAYEKMSKAVNPYGDGKACNRIVRALRGEEVARYGK